MDASSKRQKGQDYERWIAIREREDVKSDAKADKLWSLTDEGMKENLLKIEMKGIEKKMSALKTKLDVLNMEATNHY